MVGPASFIFCLARHRKGLLVLEALGVGVRDERRARQTATTRLDNTYFFPRTSLRNNLVENQGKDTTVRGTAPIFLRNDS